MRSQSVGMGLPVLPPLLFCAVCAAPTAAPDSASAPSPTITMDISADIRVGGVALGEDAVFERRVESVVGVTPIPELRIWVGMPVLFRTLELRDFEQLTTVPGDLEVAADAQVYRDAEGLHHRLLLSPAVKAPTAPVQRGIDEEALPSGLQPGCSSVVPRIAVSYMFGEGVWSLQSMAALSVPFAVREAPHRGVQAVLASSVVLEPWRSLAFRVGSMWLFEATGSDALGKAEANSGGVTGYASFAMEARWLSNLTASAGLDIPVIQSLRGEQEPTPIGSVRVSGSWDLVSTKPAQPLVAAM